MSDVIRHIFNQCDPNQEAKHDQYVDLSVVRGAKEFLQNLSERLDLTDDHKIKTLITGHSGCGKSSDLEELAFCLSSSKAEKRYTSKRYFAIRIDILDYVNRNDASISEILLSTVSELSMAFKKELDIELSESPLQKRFSEIRKILDSSVDLDKVEVPLPLSGAKASFKLNTAAPTVKDEVRRKLDREQTSIIDEINAVFEDATKKLRSYNPKDGGDKYNEIVLILDNLEKIQGVAGNESGEDSQKALFVGGAAVFNDLKIHLILTVHLSLVRAIGNNLGMLYGSKPLILPNVKTEVRGNHEKWEGGRKALEALLLKRMIPYDLSQIVDRDALDFALDYCGGHVRQFILFIRDASVIAKSAPISLEAMEEAVIDSVPSFSLGMNAGDWKLLAGLELSDDQKWDSDTEEERDLLERLCVLEYINGETSRSKFNAKAPWSAVHPIIRELDPFKQAVEVIKNERSAVK